MSKYIITEEEFINNAAESIRRKRGEPEGEYGIEDFAAAIDTIPSSVDGTDLPVGGIYLTKPDENGNPTEAYIIGYAPAINYTWTNMLGLNYFPYLKKIEFINTNNIISIVNDAFLSCTSLITINLPDSLMSIGGRAFQDCGSLITINLPNSLTSIGGDAFLSCTSLITINLPDSLMSIGGRAFGNCTSLENVTIENGFNCNNLNLSYSTKYSVETMVSWFNALADRTGQTPFTLTIGSTNLNKLTAEQKAIATNKNWTLA